MNILNKIVAHKQEELKTLKEKKSLSDFEREAFFERETYALTKFLNDKSKTGIIAEFKRQSPSKGIINARSSVTEVTQGYQKAGASAISILTDTCFFGGKNEDLKEARPFIQIPILRKDFIIDPFQIYEAKAIGADVILLIAAILSPKELIDLGKLAKSLNLSVLLEVHSKEELEQSINPYVDAIGINNRNLDTFVTNINTSFELVKLIPNHVPKVSESAIDNVAIIKELKKAGFSGFLIGECFMKTEDPSTTASAFMQELV